jgi:hypothetical protein
MTLYRWEGMSDVPFSPGWWQAGDGRWYPPPPGLTDEMPARAPTPAPDHPPYAFDPNAQRPSAPLAPTPPRQRSRRRSLILAGVAAIVIGALILTIGIAILPNSTKAASSSDLAYQMAVEDLLQSELTNLIFLETFWDGYNNFQEELKNASSAERAAIVERWLSESQSEVDQFQIDLQQIEDDFTARSYKDGSFADSIRDLATNHYKTWQNWASQIMPIAIDWQKDRTSTLGLYGYVAEVQPALDIAIETTFTELCSTLITTQPSDGSYAQTIADICPDS